MEDDSDLQKKAIIGEPSAVAIYKKDIEDYLRANKKTEAWYPEWYTDLVDAIYHENWGLAGLAEFFTDKYSDSSSAKIRGQDIFFLINGKQHRMPQKINKARRDKLQHALCMANDKTRYDEPSHEVYMVDGSRVTIYTDKMTPPDADAIIIRRYVVPEYSFEAQAERKTISYDMIEFFKLLVKLRYSTVISGAVRTAKTTMLSTMLSYIDKTLEGVLVQTDLEIRIEKILDGAPVITILADDDKLKSVVKQLMRSDCDWMVFGEARDALSLYTALEIGSTGTRGMMLTFHDKDPREVPRDIAIRIVGEMQGGVDIYTEKVAKTFDYIMHFIQLKDKSQKRLSAIYELTYDRENRQAVTKQICKYMPATDDWQWKYILDTYKEEEGDTEDEEALKLYKEELQRLATNHPAVGW